MEVEVNRGLDLEVLLQQRDSWPVSLDASAMLR